MVFAAVPRVKCFCDMLGMCVCKDSEAKSVSSISPFFPFSGHLLEKKFLSAIKESASQPSIQGKIFFIPTFYVFPILRLCRSKCKPFPTAGDDTSRLWKRIYQEIVKDSLKRVQPTSSDPM